MLPGTAIRIVTILIACSLLLAGCIAPIAAPPAPESSPLALPKGPDAVWHLVVIGDSSLWGLGEEYAARIERDMGVKVEFSDFALGGLSAGSVLGMLQTGETFNFYLKGLPAALEEAEVVVMFVNPVDSIDPQKPLGIDSCTTSHAPEGCGEEAFEKYTADLEAIWAEIFRLRKGQPTVARATDIYNPVVSLWRKEGVYEACTECWENQSAAARTAAEAYGIPFFSRYELYNGVNHDEDPAEKGYVPRNGVHPTLRANQVTADVLAEMGYDPISRP